MKELNLTQGSVPKVLLQFAVPFLIANVLQALYGGADLFVVGQYDDSASVAAVAIGSQVILTRTSRSLPTGSGFGSVGTRQVGESGQGERVGEMIASKIRSGRSWPMKDLLSGFSGSCTRAAVGC